MAKTPTPAILKEAFDSLMTRELEQDIIMQLKPKINQMAKDIVAEMESRVTSFYDTPYDQVRIYLNAKMPFDPHK